jgi:sulfur carrier protein
MAVAAVERLRTTLSAPGMSGRLFFPGPEFRPPCQSDYTAHMDTIVLNGQPRQIPPGCSVQAMLVLTGNAQRKVAIEVNRQIVPRSLHAQHLLADGDRVEIVQAFGGG